MKYLNFNYLISIGNIANIEQVGGNHYSKYHIQPWDIIADVKLDYFSSGNAKSIKESIERIIRTKYGTNNYELL